MSATAPQVDPLIYVEVDGQGQYVEESRLQFRCEWEFGADYIVCAPTHYLDGKVVKRSCHVYQMHGLPLTGEQGQIGG